MEMNISIVCVIALLATSISTAEVSDYGLYSAGEGTPIFAFQPVLRNLQRGDTHDDRREDVAESSNIIEEIQEIKGENDHSGRLKREADPGDDQEKGQVEIDVNRERGQGTRVDATVSRRVWESRDGNGRVDVHGNYGRTYGGPEGTGRPNYGGRVTYTHRFSRSLQPRDEDRRASGSNKDHGRGNIDVNVDRQRGQGTRVDVQGSGRVWESRDGNGRVDVHGNYGRTYGGPGGTGRPNYGGRITYSHRFRRSLQPKDEDKRDSGSNKDQGRGNIDINVDRQRGQGTRVDVYGSGRVWESRDGNGRVDVHGNYGRTYGGPGGTGRPNYGGRITYTHRFRRDAIADDEQNYSLFEANANGEESDESYDEHSSRTRREANPQGNQDRGRVEVDVNRKRGQGTRVDARATGKVWESRDGNGRVDVEGNYGRTYGGPVGTSRPNYGGRITYSHRFRRSQQPKDSGSNQDQGRGNIDVNVDRQRGQGTRVDVYGSGRVWESRDGNGRVDVHGNYGRTYGGPGGTGRPNYGGRITYTHRFRRDAIADDEQNYSLFEANANGEESNESYDEHSSRTRREANPQGNHDRGRVEVDVNRERGQGTRVDARATGKVWESRDGNGRVDVEGNYGRTYGGPVGTSRPNYGGRITYSHRFRRSQQPRDSGSNQDQDRGNIDVNVDRQRGQGTRVDVPGSGRVWESRDGNGRVDVHGNYGRTYGGQGGYWKA